MKKKITGWSKNYYGDKRKIKQQANTILLDLEKIKDERELTPEELVKWHHYKTLLDDIYLAEELAWKIRSKQKWLNEGDRNTKFFHTVAAHRRKKNIIHNLETESGTVTQLSDIQREAYLFYKNLLRESGFKFAE